MFGTYGLMKKQKIGVFSVCQIKVVFPGVNIILDFWQQIKLSKIVLPHMFVKLSEKFIVNLVKHDLKLATGLKPDVFLNVLVQRVPLQ